MAFLLAKGMNPRENFYKELPFFHYITAYFKPMTFLLFKAKGVSMDFPTLKVIPTWG